jgi:hypothetical protein
VEAEHKRSGGGREGNRWSCVGLPETVKRQERGGGTREEEREGGGAKEEAEADEKGGLPAVLKLGGGVGGGVQFSFSRVPLLQWSMPSLSCPICISPPR